MNKSHKNSIVSMPKEELAELVLTPDELTKIDFALPQELVSRLRDWNIDMRQFYVWSYINNETYGEPLNLAEVYFWKFCKLPEPKRTVIISLTASYYKDEVVADLLSRCERIYTSMWENVAHIQRTVGSGTVVLGYQSTATNPFTTSEAVTINVIKENLYKEFKDDTLVLINNVDVYDIVNNSKTVAEVIKCATNRAVKKQEEEVNG